MVLSKRGGDAGGEDLAVENQSMVKHDDDDDVTAMTSGSSSSDGDMHVDDKDMERLMKLESALEANAHQYEAHVEYLAVLRKCRMMERLKDARWDMLRVFPMTERMWLEWVHDDMEQASGVEDLVRIGRLFEESHGDFLSVELWMQHIE